MVSFENFVKSMRPSLSELKVKPNFCFPFKISDDLTATNTYITYGVSCYLKSPYELLSTLFHLLPIPNFRGYFRPDPDE